MRFLNVLGAFTKWGLKNFSERLGGLISEGAYIRNFTENLQVVYPGTLKFTPLCPAVLILCLEDTRTCLYDLLLCGYNEMNMTVKLCRRLNGRSCLSSGNLHTLRLTCKHRTKAIAQNNKTSSLPELVSCPPLILMRRSRMAFHLVSLLILVLGFQVRKSAVECKGNYWYILFSQKSMQNCPAYLMEPKENPANTTTCVFQFQGQYCDSCCPKNAVCCDNGTCMPYDPYCRYPSTCCKQSLCGNRCCSPSHGTPCGQICAPKNILTCCNKKSGMTCPVGKTCCGKNCCDGRITNYCNATHGGNHKITDRFGDISRAPCKKVISPLFLKPREGF